jgi:hypothetical protein
MLLLETRKNLVTLGRSVWTVQSTRYRDGSYSSPVTLACIMHQILYYIEQEVFCGEFSPPGDKKKGPGESNKRIFENFLKKFAISIKKVRSRQI